MCGIVGYTGREAAAPIVLNGLSKLEYRGYDSAGVAVFNEAENDIDIVKTKGRLKNLLEKTDSGKAMPGGCGIGHTRWATHGAPSEKNAHPHCSDDKMVVMVHNGIIENYQELKDHLTQKGYTFYSETDTEVAVKLIAYYYEKTDHNPLESMSRALLRVRGSFALGIMFKDRPGVVYAARKDSPLIVGQNEGGAFIASDVPAILSYTRNVYYLDNMEMAELHEDSIRFFNMNGDEIEKEMVNIKWDAEAAEKGGFEHFMMKEIHEQPKAIMDTMNSKIKDGRIDLSDVGLSEEDIKGIDQIYIVACGSAYHTGVVTQYVMEDLARVPVRVELASEFRYRNPILNKDDLVIVVSQSGETADTLAGLRLAKEQGAAGECRIKTPLTAGQTTIKIGAGALSATQLQSERLNIKIGAGEGIIDNLQVTDQCTAKVGVGNLELGKTNTVSNIHNLNSETAMGNTEITGKLTGNSTLKCSTGNLDLTLAGRKSNYSFSTNTTMGDITFEKDSQSENTSTENYGDVTLKCSMGAITVDFIN